MRLDPPQTSHKPSAYRVVLWIILVSSSVSILSALWLSQQPKNTVPRQILQALQNPAEFLQHSFQKRELVAELPVLSIDLKYEHNYSLQQQRQQALAEGIVQASKQDFVPASLNYQTTSIPIELRLKPGPISALTTDQWAYQVEIESDDRPLGMKRFSLYPPESSFLKEQFWLAHLQKEGLLARRSQLIKLTINGSNQGIFALEDEFSKELLKAVDRPEGLFITYRESAGTELTNIGSIDSEHSSDSTLQMSVTRPGHIKKYFGLQRQEESARAQLAAFAKGTKNAADVFDLEAMAKYLAIASLWPIEAALNNPQTTFYYNPISGKLEPVGFHYLPNAAPIRADTPPLSQWVVQLLEDPEFVATYEREHERVTQPAYIANLEKQFTSAFQNQSTLLATEPEENTVATILETLKQQAQVAPSLIEVSRELSNVAEKEQSASRQLASKAKNSDSLSSESHQRPLQAPTISDLLSQHSFLSWNADEKTLLIQTGKWQVTGDLIVPAGVLLKAEADTQLQFEPTAIFLSYSPLLFEGSSENPIVLSGKKDSGKEDSEKEDYWGGLEVWNTQTPSKLHHVQIHHTAGGTMFYQSPIEISFTQFIGSQSRDGLKLNRSDFSISDSLFKGMSDDAIDTEAAAGSLENVLFKEVGGDAIDLSESQVDLAGVNIQQVEDKGLSIGQNSVLRARDVVVTEAAVALASLDGSVATLARFQANDISLTALAAYQNSLSYSGASISVSESQFEDAFYDAIAQTNSRIDLNGDTIVGNPDSSYLLYELGITPKP